MLETLSTLRNLFLLLYYRHCRFFSYFCFFYCSYRAIFLSRSSKYPMYTVWYVFYVGNATDIVQSKNTHCVHNSTFRYNFVRNVTILITIVIMHTKNVSILYID